jgi:hypothetical protein
MVDSARPCGSDHNMIMCDICGWIGDIKRLVTFSEAWGGWGWCDEYFCEFEKKFENISGCEFGDYMGSIRRKTRRSKISCYCPFNSFSNSQKYSFLNVVPRGLIPRRTLLSGVSDPAGHCSAGYQTPQDIVLRCIRPRRTSVCNKMYTNLPLFCGVWYPARLSSAGSDTPQGLVLRGRIPRRIWFGGVSDPAGKLRPRRTRRKCF